MDWPPTRPIPDDLAGDLPRHGEIHRASVQPGSALSRFRMTCGALADAIVQRGISLIRPPCASSEADAHLPSAGHPENARSPLDERASSYNGDTIRLSLRRKDDSADLHPQLESGYRVTTSRPSSTYRIDTDRSAPSPSRSRRLRPSRAQVPSASWGASAGPGRRIVSVPSPRRFPRLPPAGGWEWILSRAEHLLRVGVLLMRVDPAANQMLRFQLAAHLGRPVNSRTSSAVRQGRRSSASPGPA